MTKIDLSQLEDVPRKINLNDLQDAKKSVDLSQLEDSPATNIFQHPVRAILDPLSKTLTGKSLQDKALEATRPEFSKVPGTVEYWNAVAKNAISGMGGSVADIATTPASYIPLPIGKLLGKIPLRGTTVGEIATKVPVGTNFAQGIKDLAKPAEVPLPTSSNPLDATPIPALTPVQKITNALKEAQPIRDTQEHLYAAERSKRAGVIESIGKSVQGEEGFYSQLRSLKGELPKVSFQGIRDKVAQEDVDSLFNTVQGSTLSPFEKITAKNGLVKLLGTEGGGVPNNSELDALGEVFPQDFIQTVLEKRPLLDKFKNEFSEALNIPRAVMSSFDLSAPLRQGVFMIGRPKQFLPAFGNMFKYFGDEKAYDGLINNIKARPTYQLMKEANLPLTDMNKQISGREEAFMSRLPEKIPLFGEGIKASNRAYTGFLNKLRADVFDDLINKAKTQGVEVTPKVLQNIGEFVGAATGRGKLPNSLESASVALNNIFFSPRLIASRLTMLNPQFYTKLDPFTRKEALKSLFTFAGTASSVLGLASLGGAKVGTDIRSSDFGKIKMGNTRYDILGGFQQYLRLAGQLVTGQQVSSTTNVPMMIGEGYKPTTNLDILARFGESKLAPIPSFIDQILKGKTFEGENLSVTKEVVNRFVPMILQDMKSLYDEKGFEGLGMAIPSIFGVGTQTYSPSPQELVYSAKSIKNYSAKLIRQGKIEEGKKFFNDNRDIVDIGTKLGSYQTAISDLEKLKKHAEEYVAYSPQKKKEMVYGISQKIEELQTKMDEKAKELQLNK